MALRLLGLRFDAVCRPDKAFMPPSGMLAGISTVGRIRRYAAIRHVSRYIHRRPDKALRRHPACAVIAAQKGDP